MTNTRSRAFKAAFPQTIPVMAGYIFIGAAYGIMLVSNGLPAWYGVLSALVVYGGSLEMMLAQLLTAPFAPLEAFLLAIMVQARHLFYGIAMLQKYRGVGIKKWYMVYTMSDETFSLNASAEIPDGIDHGWFYFWVSFLDQMWWVLGVILGGLAGGLITFNTEGITFVMTAMFTVIFLNQLMKEKKHWTALIGLASSFLCLLIFGADDFMIPSMILILVLLTVFRKPIEKGGLA